MLRESFSSRTPCSSSRTRTQNSTGNYCDNNRIFVKFINRSYKDEGTAKLQNSTFDEFTRQKFIEDQKIIMELSGRLQELQNEVNCMNDSKDFQDAESVRSGNSHVTSQPGVFPKHPPFEGLLRPSFVSPRHTDGPPNIWDTSGISGNVFAHPQLPFQLRIFKN